MRTVTDPSDGGPPRYSWLHGALALATALGLALLLLVALGWRVAAYPTGITDLGSYFLPKYQYAADRIASGELPLWNPYEFAGIPFLATFQPAVFYPPLRAAYALSSGEVAYTATFFFHILIGAVTTLVLMRSFGAGLWASALASLWVLQPSWVMRVWDHPVYIWGATWVPLLILLVRRTVREPDRRVAGWLALVAALQVWSGYPFMILATSYLLLLGLPFFFAEAHVDHDVRAITRVAGTLAIAAVATALLTAAQVLPTAELAANSARGSVAVAGAQLAKQIAASGTLGFWIGIPRSTVVESLRALWDLYGPLLLGLCAGALLLRRRSRLVWYAAAGTILCSLLPLWLYQKLPFYRFVRFALEWAFIAPLMVYVLAGLGFDAICRRLHASPFRAGAAAMAIGGLSLLWNWQVIDANFKVNEIDLGLGMPGELATECGFHGTEYRSYWYVGQLRGALMRERVRSIGGYEQSLLPRRIARLIGELRVGNGGLKASMGRDIAKHQPGYQRMGLRCFLSSDVNDSTRLQSAGFEEIPGVGSLEGTDKAYRSDDALPRARLAFASRVAQSAEEALSLVLSSPPSAVVLEDESEPLPSCPEPHSGVARIVVDEPEHVAVHVDTPCPAYLVLGDVLVPGWSATLDGSAVPIHAADYAFRAVRVPAGRHEVVFRYAPTSVRVGLLLSALGLAAVVLLLARPGRLGSPGPRDVRRS